MNLSQRKKLVQILSRYWQVEPREIAYSMSPEGVMVRGPYLKVITPAELMISWGEGSVIPPGDITGKAAGKIWTARRPKANGMITASIHYQGEDFEPMLTPARLPSILNKIKPKGLDAGNIQEYRERLSSHLDKALEEIDGAEKDIARKELEKSFSHYFQPEKSLTMVQIGDKEQSMIDWDNKNSMGVSQSKNPILQSSLKGSKLKTFFKTDDVKLNIGGNWKYPQTIEELRRYVAAAFSGESYRAMMGLSYMANQQSGRKQIRVKVSEFCGLVLGPGYTTKQREGLLDTLDALQLSSFSMITPWVRRGKRRGESEYIFTPLLFSRIDWKDKREGGIPEYINLELWPQSQGQDFTTAMVPSSVFQLNKNDFPLYSYLLVQQQHYARNGKVIKCPEPEIMRAAALEGTWKGNPRKGVYKLKKKIEKLEEMGLSGKYIGNHNGNIEIAMLGNGTGSPQIAPGSNNAQIEGNVS